MQVLVYILLCSDGTHYTGITKDLKSRLHQHSNGHSKSTRNRLPIQLIYSKAHEGYEGARKAEVYIKGFGAKKYLTRLDLGNEMPYS